MAIYAQKAIVQGNKNKPKIMLNLTNMKFTEEQHEAINFNKERQLLYGSQDIQYPWTVVTERASSVSTSFLD